MSDARGALIIAEAGVNHNGSVDRALELVDAAQDCGADIVKFQTFSAEALAAAAAPKAEYQAANTGAAGAQLEMLRALELDEAAHRRLVERCAERGIEFLSTAFDARSLDLVLSLGVRRLKMPSGEITNGPLLLKAARSGLPILLSTGMADLKEIESALGVLAFGYSAPREAVPSPLAFRAALLGDEGQRLLTERVTVLHCTTQYPAPLEDVNLRAMDTITRRFNLKVGYSDHTLGIAVAIAAVARGAVAIEKHLTLDRSLPGPDHKASLEPPEFKAMVAAIRGVEAALGTPDKRATDSERPNIPVARKSLVAARPIAQGETFTAENLTMLRPGGGRSPMEYWSLLGQPAPRDYKKHEPV
ncbi:MAG: N-acetylneuraminate synthase [Alphaproteobacteria bacterium]|nr:N-acetylneuraminate synthase [Alphaproteobacteria bacterium]